jgi:hypothetical protein
MKPFLDWASSRDLHPDYICYHDPGRNFEKHLQNLHTWGYDQPVYIGEYLSPIVHKDEEGNIIHSESGYGRPGKFAYLMASMNNEYILGGGIGPWGTWNAGGTLKGLNGLVQHRGTTKLTNLGYVYKLYVEATGVNDPPLASVLQTTRAEYTKIFATRKDNKIHILMGAFGKDYPDPVINQLKLTNAENSYYKVT